MRRTSAAFALAGLLVAGVAGRAPAQAPSKGMTVQPADSAQVYAESRVALVIGNGAYAAGPLRNPPNDAEDVARVLQERRFEVIKVIDGDQRAMDEAIRAFGSRLKKGGTGVFYYSGHGMQVGGVNYLIPVNAEIPSESHVKYRAIDAGLVLAEMEAAGNRLNVVVLDACRDNPFARSFKSAGQGLVKMDAPTGTLIAYATGPGRTAAEGAERNGVYTKHLLGQMQTPGQKVEEALKRVREGVTRETGGAQVPWELSSLTGDFFFTPADFALQREGPLTAELERLRALEEQRRQADEAQREVQKRKEAEIEALERQIEAKRKELGQSPGGGTLEQLHALLKQKEQQARDLEELRRKAEAERRAREEELKRQQEAVVAARHVAFTNSYAKYLDIVESALMTDADKTAAWQAICADWGVGQPGPKPAGLEWRPDGTVALSSAGFPAPPGKALNVDLGGGVAMEFVWIAPGTFTMGSPAGEEGRNDDEVQHEVRLTKGFWMGKTEVTQAQWERVMGSNPSHFKNAGEDAPVADVSWDDCQGFVRKLNDLRPRTENGEPITGFRLPTEAEWEYACRAGTTGPFHCGSSLDASMANFDGNYPYGAGSKGEYRQRTMPVGSFKPNAWGLYDMHGNVWEWCQDWYGAYPTGAVTDPTGPSSGSARVLRGGSWNFFARLCRSAYRDGRFPSFRDFFYGFRVVGFR